MAKRLTGVSTLWGGLQWETIDGDKDVARRVINFLEDRRLLFGGRHIEDAMYCIHSAIEIRATLTREINAARPGKTLEQSLKAMRASCRKFVDAAGPNAENFNRRLTHQEAGEFGLALGDLRTSVGIQIALVADRFGIPVDRSLATILPPSDDGDASWVPGFRDAT